MPAFFPPEAEDPTRPLCRGRAMGLLWGAVTQALLPPGAAVDLLAFIQCCQPYLTDCLTHRSRQATQAVHFLRQHPALIGIN